MDTNVLRDLIDGFNFRASQTDLIIQSLGPNTIYMYSGNLLLLSLPTYRTSSHAAAYFRFLFPFI